LIKLVTRQVLAGRPSHETIQPPSSASTDFKLQIPCYRPLESMPVKQTRERLQSGADRPPWSAGHHLCPLVSGLYTLSPRVRCIPMVTLILVEFQIFL
jgi:hypothetical protein